MIEDIVMEPPLYFAQNHIWNVCFHPTSDVIACCEITGDIEILSYNSEDVKQLLKINSLHKSSCRYCTFNQSGDLLATCGKDKRLGFVDSNGKIAHIIKKAHQTSINRIKFLDDKTIISGDDDGNVKIWDLRTTVSVFEADSQGQAITGIFYDESTNYLLSSSLEGNIAVYDLKQGTSSQKKLVTLSDSIDEEILGLQVLKNKKYIVCPTGQGSIVLYKWGNFQSFTDRMHGHPNSIDAIIKLDQNTVITGSQDGYVRGVNIKPNKIVQVLGQHEQQQNFPIQSLSLSRCKNFVASSSHDSSIKFYDVSEFGKKQGKKLQEDEQIMQENEEQIKHQNSDQYDSEMQDQDSDSEEQTNQKTNKKRRNKKITLKARTQQIKRQKKKEFFKGLEEQ